MSKVYITDYVDNPSIERNILKEKLSDSLLEGIEVLLDWNENITKNFINKLPTRK